MYKYMLVKRDLLHMEDVPTYKCNNMYTYICICKCSDIVEKYIYKKSI